MNKKSANQTLPLEQDLSFQQSFWKIQRIGWVIALLIMLIALFGFTGSTGPLNATTVKQEDIQADYQPYARKLSSTQIQVAITHSGDQAARLWIDRSIIDKYQIQRITPQPDSIASADSRIEYRFNSTQPSLTVTLEGKPKEPGVISGRIGQTNGGMVEISQLVYP